jgi:hypothetical protein
MALLAERPGVFDTSRVGQPTRLPLGDRFRAWLRRLFNP